jgi:hypothetical protein
MTIDSLKGKLLAHAFGAAPAAFVFGLFLVRAMKDADLADVTVAVLSGLALVFVLFRTRRWIRRLAAGEPAKPHAKQFLWSCTFLGMISLGFGMQVAGFAWFSTDFMRTFGAVFWAALTAVATYPVRRDAKRLADAAGQGRS